MKRILLLAILSLAVSLVAGESPYDFRASEAYRQLSVTDRQRLEQVHRDLVLLWGALDMYADDHQGNLPSTLDELVPRYLAELPSDPFVTRETASVQTTYDTQSKGGKGYRFREGSPGNRAWVISSVGLPGFPYLAERGKCWTLHLQRGLDFRHESGKGQMTAIEACRSRSTSRLRRQLLSSVFGVAGASRNVCCPTGMKSAVLLCILLTLCGCRTSHRTAALQADAPPALNSEFLRADHASFSRQDRDLIATAWHGIHQADKLPKGGSEDAYYRVRHTSDGHEVFAIYVTGYDKNQPVLTPCVHNAVLLSPEGEVLRVLSGPECWP